MRDDLEELVQEAHRLGYYTNLITSGVGLTPARAQRLGTRGSIMCSCPSRTARAS